jgi:D-alanyl-D-alanine dipeptidase
MTDERNLDTSHLPIAVSANDVDYQLAYAAHSNSCHRPDVWAKHAQESYVRDMLRAYQLLSDTAQCAEQTALIPNLLERFKAGYLERKVRYLSAESRTASSMVTGPANFNVERNRKRMAVADRRGEELQAYIEVSEKRMVKAIRGAATDEVRNETEYKRLQEATVYALEMVKRIEAGEPYARDGFTTNLKNKLVRAANKGFRNEVKTVLQWLKDHEQEYVKAPIFAPHNAVWGCLTREPYDNNELSQNQGASHEPQTSTSAGDVTLTVNEVRNGIELRFADKPCQAILEQLHDPKSGFRFSFKQKLWYARKTEQTLALAQSIVQQCSNTGS